jgi:hypothetical protein
MPTIDSINSLGWFTPSSGTPDNFHSCFNPYQPFLAVPDNNLGYQSPHTGQAYAGLGYFILGNNYREYIETKLDSALQSGKTYLLTAYVSLADISGYAVSNIEFYFSPDSLLDTTSSYPLISASPQIVNSTTISDTAGWTSLSFSYTASGGEQFLTIGNFSDSANTNYVPAGDGSTPMAYYFIDDISLISYPSIGITETNESVVVEIGNGATTSSIVVKLPKSENNVMIKIFDLTGREIKSKSFSGAETSISLANVESGIYFVQLYSSLNISIGSKKLFIE